MLLDIHVGRDERRPLDPRLLHVHRAATEIGRPYACTTGSANCELINMRELIPDRQISRLTPSGYPQRHSTQARPLDQRCAIETRAVGQPAVPSLRLCSMMTLPSGA
jgi:hypothetical protein